MSYSRFAGLSGNYNDYVESAGTIGDVVRCQEVSGGSAHSRLFGVCDDIFGSSERLIGAGLYFDKNDGSVGVDHDKVDFAGLAGEVPR